MNGEEDLFIHPSYLFMGDRDKQPFFGLILGKRQKQKNHF